MAPPPTGISLAAPSTVPVRFGLGLALGSGSGFFLACWAPPLEDWLPRVDPGVIDRPPLVCTRSCDTVLGEAGRRAPGDGGTCKSPVTGRHGPAAVARA